MTATRTTSTVETTTVRYFAKPLGQARENGPHLSDLRAFVEACEGLPDDTKVTITKGHMGESGRYDVEFVASHRTPVGKDR